MGLILGSSVDQDGHTAALMAPNGAARRSLIRDAVRRAGISPSDVDYVEAHGTGTPLGDPIEIGALARVMSDQPRDRALWVGSVKTNIGHLEPAAGVASIIKVVLSMGHGQIPAHLHLQTPSTHIPWGETRMKVPPQLMNWPSQGRRVAGVSAFGFGGTNAHLVLSAAPPALPATHEATAAPATHEAETAERPRHLLLISARSEAALRQLASRYAEHLSGPEAAAGGMSRAAHRHRARFAERLALVAGTAQEASLALGHYVKQQPAERA